MPRLTFPEYNSAISAVGRGELMQIRILGTDLFKRIEELEEKMEGSQTPQSPNLDSVKAVNPPPADAKTIDVREAVIDLTEAFNNLVKALKGESNG